MSLLMKPEPFSQEFDRLFTRLFDAQHAPAQRWVPAMDLTEAEDHFVLKADLPGLGEDDVSIEVQDNTLTISGERSAEHVQREKGWHRIERAFGRFSRALTLPDGVNPDGVTAEFDKGVLSVRIPKPEARQPRRIAISAGGGASATNGHPAVEGAAEERK
jgi:HSP20 family protein